MDSVTPTQRSRASSVLLEEDSQCVETPEAADSIMSRGSIDDPDGIGEVWYRPPIPDPPPSKVSLRLHTTRAGDEGAMREEIMESPVLERSATGLSVSSRCGRSNGEPVVKRKKSIRVIASEYKKTLDEALRAWVSPHLPETEGVGQRRPLKKLLKRKMTSDSDSDTPAAMSCKWVRGEPIGSSTRMYLALNMKNGEMMVLKQAEIPSVKKKHRCAKQVEDLERLKKETEILAGLEHPNVVQYLGYEETHSIYNLFLGYVSGGSVAALIRKYGKLEETVARYFLKQVVEGMDHLHSKGIIHRSLLSDNVLVEINGVIKIAGFGAAEKTPESTSNQEEGSETVYWIAPEVMNLRKNGNKFKVDIWSVGCLFLEMMTGLGSWSEAEEIMALSQLSDVGSPLVSSYATFSELADDFRRDCLAIDPDERASASELRTHGYLELPPGWHFDDRS